MQEQNGWTIRWAVLHDMQANALNLDLVVLETHFGSSPSLAMILKCDSVCPINLIGFYLSWPVLRHESPRQALRT